MSIDPSRETAIVLFFVVFFFFVFCFFFLPHCDLDISKPILYTLALKNGKEKRKKRKKKNEWRVSNKRRIGENATGKFSICSNESFLLFSGCCYTIASGVFLNTDYVSDGQRYYYYCYNYYSTLRLLTSLSFSTGNITKVTALVNEKWVSLLLRVETHRF